MNNILPKTSNKSRISILFVLLILLQIAVLAMYLLVKLKLGISDVETYRIIQDSNFPRIEIEGYKSLDGKGKSAANIKYYNNGLVFEEMVDISIQGGTSVFYPKKNYNIDILTEGLSDESNIQFGDWYKMDRYCLKANYVDFSMARNTVASKLWGDIVERREHINPNLEEIINYGAVDGFPVALYLNGKYKGIYNVNTSKDCLFENMKSGSNQAVLFGDNLDAVTVQLKETSDEYPPNGGWQLIYNSADNTQWITDSFNQLISLNINNDDEAFKQGIDEYLDVEAAIDYLIYYQFLCLVDNQYKNMMWVTYDGTQWIPSAYDLDKSFGLDLNGIGFFSTDELLPYYDSKEQTFYANSKNALWNRLLNTHREEIAARYFELREGPLSIENISARFNEFNNEIPQELFRTEAKLWPAIPSLNISDISTILEYQTKRAEVMDRFYSLYASKDGFCLDGSEEFTIYTVTVECPLRDNDLIFKMDYNQQFFVDSVNKSPFAEYEFDKLVYKGSDTEFVNGTGIIKDTELEIIWKQKEIKQTAAVENPKPQVEQTNKVEEVKKADKTLKVRVDEFVKGSKEFINKVKAFVIETRSESFFILIFIIIFIILIVVYLNSIRYTTKSNRKERRNKKK